ncbi:CAF17-like 4Fe-4S cluster assembly/insertion protein YgfZ [Lichenifustis flavocetrariae]|uniref:Folate-binding protein n=1 Tax=Lichenifustis flavocetrariae TaxID=2949735 RepID=A0AA41Z1G2_9HYPH|nr:folate-binding protein [Lichenifustis flavocetrariae]MCW6511231.1 folate-binding protein [Lichenifustis flavocetrariae]
MESGASTDRRGVVEVSGPEARDFLQRLVTNDVEKLTSGQACYAALLTPQGKIIVDFMVVAAPEPDLHERFLLDCPAVLAPDLARRLTLYKLRAKVTIADRSGQLGASPLVGDIAPTGTGVVIYADPRSANLGNRAVGPSDLIMSLAPAPADYRTRRILAVVPEGGLDFTYGDSFPHEANLDRLYGVDFTKGCYVGQEVVSRMQHRSTTRKRVTPVHFPDAPPKPGSEILAGDLPIGTVGTVEGGRGLAMLRLDRVADATATGTAITAAGQMVEVDRP